MTSPNATPREITENPTTKTKQQRHNRMSSVPFPQTGDRQKSDSRPSTPAGEGHTRQKSDHLYIAERGRKSSDAAGTSNSVSSSKSRSPRHCTARANGGTGEVLPALVVPGSYPTLRIDEAGTKLKELSLDLREDLYKLYFAEQRHYNWIGSSSLKKENSKVDHFVISVLYQPIQLQPPTFRGLKTTKKGSEEFVITIEEDNVLIFERINSAVKQKEPEAQLFFVKDGRKFSREFLALEQKHPQKLTEMKIGVIYCKPGQTNPQDMFKNGQGDELCQSFWTWANVMGKEINLENWSGYKGDMGNTGKTFYKKWNVNQNDTQVEIIYHMAPLMDAEGHRRLIGNDMAVIFFLEEGHNFQLNPTCVEALGTVPQIFMVVQPYQNKYRVGFFSYIKPFDPVAPAYSAISTEKMIDLVLTKLYNGCLMVSRFCPPMHRLFYVPRGETLEAIVEKFLPTQAQSSSTAKKLWKKDKDEKYLEEKRRKPSIHINNNTSILLTESDFIRVTVVAACIESDQMYDLVVTLSLVGTQHKTKITKHCVKPIWNEDFMFDLLGVDKDFTDLKVFLHCNRTNTCLGEVRIPLFEVMNLIGLTTDAQWFVLMRKNAEDKRDKFYGVILLKFSSLSDQDVKQHMQVEQPKTPRAFRKSTILSSSKPKTKV